MIIIVWVLLFGSILYSLGVKNFISLWISISFYIILVLVRANEAMGNYYDLRKKRLENEKLQLENKAEEMAGRGLAFSGIRNKEEERIKDDFKFENKKAKRKLYVDLINTLLLKNQYNSLGH